MNAVPKAISFDAAGTLFELAEPVGWTYSRFADQGGIEACPEAVQAGFGEAWKCAVRQPPTAPGGDKDWWRHLVAQSFVRAGVSIEEGSPAFGALFEDLFKHYAGASAWRLFPETRAVLRYCRQRLRLVVVSNFDQRLRTLLGELGIADCFEALLLSDDHGWRKPDSRLFAAAAAALEIEIEALLHVGDDPVCDWQGAEDAGCAVFRIDRPRSTLNELSAVL